MDIVNQLTDVESELCWQASLLGVREQFLFV